VAAMCLARIGRTASVSSLTMPRWGCASPTAPAPLLRGRSADRLARRPLVVFPVPHPTFPGFSSNRQAGPLAIDR
jgi:hypothetical protein